MALAQIIDLDEVRRARRVATSAADNMPMWCCYWVPVMYWYVP